MTGILKDFHFAIAYLDDIIIFSRMAEEHLYHIKRVFEKLRAAKLSTKLSNCHFFSKEIQYLGHILSTEGTCPLPLNMQSIQKMYPPTTPKHVHAFLGLVGYYRRFIKNFMKIAKPLTLLTNQQVKFDWTPTHHKAFLHLKESMTQAPILGYPDPNKRYIVYTDASDDACGKQLSQEHDGTEFQIAFLIHSFGNTKEMEHNQTGSLWSLLCHYKMNYYLQGVDIIVRNDCKPLTKFLNGKNAKNKVNIWGLELATYDITFEWISGADNKAADCLS